MPTSEDQPTEQAGPQLAIERGKPWVSAHHNTAQDGALVILTTTGGKRYLISLHRGQTFHTNLGHFRHDDLIGQPLGTTVHSQLGHPLLLLEPSLSDLITRVKRNTQIIYPKDAAYLVHRLSLRSGDQVIEAGTGSGGLTIALAWAVAPAGRVYTYEVRSDNYQLARTNLERVGLLGNVSMHQQSVAEGFRQQGADAVFLDVRTPGRYLQQVREALRPGGFFAALVPTVNQVIDLLAALERGSFADIAIEELLLRKYKVVPDRLRPDDAMVGHTGFLVSARPVIDPTDPGRWLSEDRKRYTARKEFEAKIEAEEARRLAEKGEQDGPYRMPLP
ncbi:MAG: tRNA (adenine-N1)-methyltransferase [Caldilineaceae bacterium]|nr:tRNA (adenine-N1)-methyltransferase [Caldilineaceae bacterium]